MRKAYVFLLAVALLVFGGPARATVFGGLRGIVHDPQHRPIPGAQVRLKSATSDWSQQTQTNQDGEFEFATVPIGDYTVTASASGFQNLQQSITVTADSSPVLHFPLAIASVSQTATVSAQAPVGNVDSATSITLLDRSDIALTPGADRSNSLAMITDFVPGCLSHARPVARSRRPSGELANRRRSHPEHEYRQQSLVRNSIPRISTTSKSQRGSYEADMAIAPMEFSMLSPGPASSATMKRELITSFGNFYQTNDQFNFGGHTQRFAYYASVNGNRSNLGLQTPVGADLSRRGKWLGGFGSLIFNATPRDQLRLVTSLRRDYYQIPYDPNPNDSENQQFQTSGLRDGQHESDDFRRFFLGSHLQSQCRAHRLAVLSLQQRQLWRLAKRHTSSNHGRSVFQLRRRPGNLALPLRQKRPASRHLRFRAARQANSSACSSTHRPLQHRLQSHHGFRNVLSARSNRSFSTTNSG